MKVLAQAALDYLMFLSVTDDERLDPELAAENLEALRSHLEEASPEERSAVSKAAKAALASASDQESMAAALLSDREKEILASVADGSIFEPPEEEDDEEDWSE